MTSLAEQLGVSVGVVILLVAVLVAQATLQFLALVSLYRSREVLFNSKWLWLAVVLLLGLVGSLLYFALGRRLPAAAPTQSQAVAGPRANSGERAGHAVDVLYGRKEEP